MFGIFSKKFHKKTDFNFPIGMPPSNPQYWPKEWREIFHKSYPRLPKIKLSKKNLDLGHIENALKKRCSTREYDTIKTISLNELSTLLYYSAGVKNENKQWNEIRRHYPSGGARYPLETYLLIQRVENITPGVYHYNVKDHVLEALSTSLTDIERTKEGLLYPWSRDAAVIFFVTAVWNRNFMKYKDRGYRIVLIEAGHMAQNLVLTAANMGLKNCPSVGFHNQRINEVLEIENEIEDSIYMVIISK